MKYSHQKKVINSILNRYNVIEDLEINLDHEVQNENGVLYYPFYAKVKSLCEEAEVIDEIHGKLVISTVIMEFNTPTPLSPLSKDERELINNNDKIAAVIAIRQRLNCSLKVAQDMILDHKNNNNNNTGRFETAKI